MVAVLQRVLSGSVTINKRVAGEIGNGMVILLGIFNGDTEREAQVLADKTANLRIFSDDSGKMNLSLIEVGGEALVISQFTLCADYRKGRRPNFLNAAEPTIAKELYTLFQKKLLESDISVKSGKFGGMMDVELINNGPVTIILDTDNLPKA